MGKKPKPFFVNAQDGTRRKVKPRTKSFSGSRGDYRLDNDLYLNGTVFPAGYYPFVFWDMPIYDRHDNPIPDDGVSSGVSSGGSSSDSGSYNTPVPDIPTHHHGTFNPDPTPSYTPEPSHHSHDFSSSSFDSGSSSGSYDSGSSGGSFDGGGGGGSDF